jgi:Mg-chelatase subunit ChlD
VKGSGSDRGTSGEAFDGAASPSAATGAASATSSSSTTTTQYPAGTLTAGVWDDNLNFDRFQAYRGSLGQLAGLPGFTTAEQQDARAASLQAASGKAALDIAIVIDTTGSMGDEISWLQSEFQAITHAVEARFPGVPQRYALVDYRDTTDAFIVRGVDFGSSASWFDTQLATLNANGGGDFPESPDQALAQAAALSWSTSPDTARLVFWVADAPHHDDKAADLTNAVRALATKGIHVYPVASSGVDELTEYTMRATAQLTLGRYLFLTDDSGVGGEHKAPSVPCFHVAKLTDAVSRMIDIELTGAHVPQDAATILRSEGAPQGDVCTLADGTFATLY